MERVGGDGDLFDAIVTKGRLEDDVARRYFGQLLDAIEHCHSRGVCHRDIKPENVLLDKKGGIKLTGFALAGLFDPSIGDDVANLLHATCGTPDYIAPEVIQGVGYDGRPADLWSAGVCLYCMLAGFLPFEADQVGEKFDKIQAGDFKIAPGISLSACSLLECMLEPDPKKRYTMANVHSHPWLTQRPPSGGRSTTSSESRDAASDNSGGTTSTSSSEASEEFNPFGGRDAVAQSNPCIGDGGKGENGVGSAGDDSIGSDKGFERDLVIHIDGNNGGGAGSVGNGTSDSSERCGKYDSLSSYPDSLYSDGREGRASITSSGENSYTDDTQPGSISPSGSSLSPRAQSYLFSNRHTGYCGSSSPSGSSCSPSRPDSASSLQVTSTFRAQPQGTPAAHTGTRAKTVRVQEVCGEKVNSVRLSQSSLRDQQRAEDKNASSRKRLLGRRYHRCHHKDLNPETDPGERRKEEQQGQQNEVTTAGTKSAEQEQRQRLDIAVEDECEMMKMKDIELSNQQMTASDADGFTPKTARNTPASEWSPADGDSRQRGGTKQPRFFFPDSLSPPPPRTPATPRRGGDVNPTAAREAALDRLASLQTGAIAATSASASSTYSPTKSVNSSTISNAIATPTWKLSETRMAMRRLGPTRLLLSLPESEPLNLAKTFKVTLEDLGCFCRLQPNPKHIARARVKACRTIPSPRPPGEETIVGVVFSILYPGVASSPTLEGFDSGGSGAASGGHYCGEESSGINHGSGGGVGSVGGGDGAGQTNCGWNARGTHVLVVLSTGTLDAFDSLIEDLLGVKDRRWHATTTPSRRMT
ncbi:unnamed protein product [Pylaiella littoralis]